MSLVKSHENDLKDVIVKTTIVCFLKSFFLPDKESLGTPNAGFGRATCPLPKLLRGGFWLAD